ncbi:MAG: DUF4912 domain-containing protein [Candidatus Omnitrophica bacterium]|nr:DUF4912 domain-containing protein [Candidatus Omnitrophota bacterium]
MAESGQIKGNNKRFNMESGLPDRYNDNKAVLMVRDPWTLFSYWEIKEDVENRVKEEIRKKGLSPLKSVLRVYNVTSGATSKQNPTYEFELRDWASNWYIHLNDTGLSWMIQIGIMCKTGEFFLLAESNIVTTPSNRMSDVYDEQWMCSEDLYYRMFAIAGGYDIGKSSFELKELIEAHLRSWRFSGAVTSGSFHHFDSFTERK